MSIVNQSVVSTTKCLFNQVAEGNLSRVQVYFASLGFLGVVGERKERRRREACVTGHI